MASIRIGTQVPLSIPAVTKHTATVIFAHGLGDSGQGWAWMVENFRRRELFPEVKFILPSASIMPVTCNGGAEMRAWYDIAVINGSIEGLRTSEDHKGIEASKGIFHALIKDEISSGIPSERIVLGGFSQGGAISIYSGLSAPFKLAGILGLSCYLLRSKVWEQEAERIKLVGDDLNKDTPILMMHGEDDMVVNTELGKMSSGALQKMGYKVDWKTYPDTGHSVHPDEFNTVQAFLSKQLPPLEHSEL